MQTSLAQARIGTYRNSFDAALKSELHPANETPSARADLTVIGVTVQGHPAANALVSHSAARCEGDQVFGRTGVADFAAEATVIFATPVLLALWGLTHRPFIANVWLVTAQPSRAESRHFASLRVATIRKSSRKNGYHYSTRFYVTDRLALCVPII